MPSDAAASITSDSLMPPTPSWTTFTVTCCCGSFAISSASASSEPATSAFRIRFSSRRSPCWARANTSSSETFTPARRAIARQRAGATLVLDDAHVLAGLGHAVEAEHLDRVAGLGDLQLLAAVVVHRADATPVGAGHEGVAYLERAALDEHGHDGPAPGVEPRLDHGARRLGLRVRLQLLELGEGHDVLEQLLEALPRLGGDVR